MERENGMNQAVTRDTAWANGMALYYEAVGEGRPVVLLHGNGEDHTLFAAQVRQLTAAGYRVYTPDSRGHGMNPPLEEYHYADMAEDVYQLIAAWGLSRPALYGHSDGGIIGLLLALAHPEALSLLAVSGTNLSPAGLKPDFLVSCAGDNSPLTRLMLTEPHIVPTSLRRIKLPVLVTAGSDDLILPEETRRLAACLPRAELHILEGHDHGSYIHNSEIMGRLLLDFFQKHGY